MTEEVMHHHKKPVTIVTPIEVGIGESQVLVVTEIPLRPPAGRIVEIFREVEVTSCKPVNNKAIINGELHQTIFYLTECGGAGSGSGPVGGIGSNPLNPKKPHVPDHGCGESHMQCRVRSTDVKGVCADVPFAMFVEVPGSREGDICIIEEAIVEGSKEMELNPQNNGTFGTLLDKTVIKVVAKVARQKQIPIRPEWP